MFGLSDETLMQNADSIVPAGSVVLLGGGPGDPELITLAGLKALAVADVVLIDHLAPQELHREFGPHVEIIDVAKHPRGKAVAQSHINDLMVDRAKRGKRVVRFKGGEGFVFGRGYEEVVALQESGISVRVIPGLTSPVAVPVLAGIPITARGLLHDFTVVSGHVPPSDPSTLVNWEALAKMTGTLIFLMAVHNMSAISATLIDLGKPAETPLAIVVEGSLPSERTIRTTLGEVATVIERESVSAPAIFVIGAVAALGAA